MSNSLIEIDAVVYKLDEVLLSLDFSKTDDDYYLELNIFADTDNLKRAGLAINCITLQGLKSDAELESVIFEISDESNDDLNEISESVICLPGKVLELKYLKLHFNHLVDGIFNISISAVCIDSEKEIDVTGQLFAKVEIEYNN